MKYGCIGRSLGHSYSIELHAMLGDYTYELCELREDELGAFFAARDFLGINVTVPYKQAVIPYLDRLDASVTETGAVNTVINSGDTLVGYNTDIVGMEALCRRVGVPMSGKKVAILGGGGTARTAWALAKRLGAASLITVSRSGREGTVSYDELYAEHTDTEYLINTTPLGMYPELTPAAVDPARLPRLKALLDAVYNPIRTSLVLEARRLGIPAEGGLYMLVSQAVAASELFLGRKYPDGICGSVYERLLGKKENIVLIGMPASGKSSTGRVIAERLGRSFFDSDDMVMEKVGKSIPEIFSSDGEAEFRRLEAEVIESLAAVSGAVISTGGGVILNEGNVKSLAKNGRLYYLDRAPESLIPTNDRPTAKSREDILKRYGERYERYISAADCVISPGSTPEECADRVIKEFFKL